MASEVEITKDTIIADLIRAHPECIDVFVRHAWPCTTCMGASDETIEEGAVLHHVDADALLSELRECVRGV